MPSLNKVMLIGHVGTAPEMKSTGAAKSLCKFTLATNERKKGGREETTWHTVVCFDKTADACVQFLNKGHLAYVEGRIQTRSWEKDGQKKYATEIVAERVLFMNGGKSNGNDASRVSRNEKGSGTDRSASDDDIPF